MYRPRILALMATLTIVAAACGSDGSSDETGIAESATEAGDNATDSSANDSSADDDTDNEDAGDLPNACPAEGCTVSIESVESVDDSTELLVTFDANFTPDFERNHIHVFWDTYEPGSVSSDFQENGFDEQGKWHPTDEYPEYTTQSDASVDSEFRQGSTTLCVTAADTDHAVLDPSLFQCEDVTDLLS